MGAGELITYLSVEHHILVWCVVLNYGHIYQQDTEQIPLDASEEVGTF